MRRCEWCGDTQVPDAHAIEAATEEPGSGPGGPPGPSVYACPKCARLYGVLPLRDHPAGSTGAPLFVSPAYIGHRDMAPERPTR